MRLFKKKVFSIIVALIMIVSIPTKATTLMTEGKFDVYSSVYDLGEAYKLYMERKLYYIRII